MPAPALIHLLSTFSTVFSASRLYRVMTLGCWLSSVWVPGLQDCGPSGFSVPPLQTLQEERGSIWLINQYSIPHSPGGMSHSSLRPYAVPRAPLMSGLSSVPLALLPVPEMVSHRYFSSVIKSHQHLENME